MIITCITSVCFFTNLLSSLKSRYGVIMGGQHASEKAPIDLIARFILNLIIPGKCGGEFFIYGSGGEWQKL